MVCLRYSCSAVVAALLVFLSGCSGSEPTSNSSPTQVSSASSPQISHSDNHQPKININNAILSQLDKLEAKLAIPALSNKIQASRPYGSVEELVSKNVLTQEQFDQIKDMVTTEDIVLEGEAKDIDYTTKLGLMKGHLFVANELLALGKPQQAEPHIGHPVEEIYADVEDQLTERKVSEFKTTLITLQDFVKSGAKDQEKVTSQFKTSMQAIDQALAAIPEQQMQSPSFVLQVINGLLDTANSEYGAAVLNGKIGAEIEYQDSRGFVNYATQLYQSISPQIQKTNPKADKTIQTTLAQLKTVWPSVLPPATPVKTPQEVAGLIKTIEKTSNQLILAK